MRTGCSRTPLFLCTILILLFQQTALAENVELEATADIWLSDANEGERDSSSGKARRFKLKSIQEMAAIRFDATPIQGREILSARLFLHPVQPDRQLRYVRLSTINQDWVEGRRRRAYSRGGGATYNFASHEARRPWAWPGSQFCDVTFSSGHSLSSWAELRKESNGWISVAVDPLLVVAMAVGDTDGIAMMEGGTTALFNNFVHSRESGRYAPFLRVEVGSEKTIVPARPVVRVEPDPGHAGRATGAVRVWVSNAQNVFCWRVNINGQRLDRWQVPHPREKDPVEFSISSLPPLEPMEIEVVAVSRTGHASRPVKATARASASLDLEAALGQIRPPSVAEPSAPPEGSMHVWALPALVKLNPVRPEPLQPDMGWDAPFREANAVWDGLEVGLFGMRGEYVDFQLCVEALQGELEDIRVTLGPLNGPEGEQVEPDEITLYCNWYTQTSQGQWHPAYTIPLEPGARTSIPDRVRGIENQQNQTFWVDVYIPKDAAPGIYTGIIRVSARDAGEVRIPVRLEVHPACMPDELAFFPEMNAYHIPQKVHDFYRLAHEHRCVPNFWAFEPKLQGRGETIRVVWKEYDERVGPLLTGKAFKDCRRGERPVECLYLPYLDSWPTELSKKTYRYEGHWPGRGESRDHLTTHYLTSPYIGAALSPEYKAAFLAVQRQFVEHFHEKGWDRTELQCFFGGKKTHRIRYGSNMWWTTDEPAHWGDWLALRFFMDMWTRGRNALGASEARWAARADISRPQWQGTVLKGCVDSVYYGGFADERTYRRCRILKEETGIRVRAYGSANAHDRSNTETVALVLNTWLNGAEGFQCWWSTGGDRSLDVQEACPGNALLVPGDRFGLPVVGDMRLKAFRKGEQLVEYLILLAEKHGLSRAQLRHMVARALFPGASWEEGETFVENTVPVRYRTIEAWRIEGLRREILKGLLTLLRGES